MIEGKILRNAVGFPIQFCWGFWAKSPLNKQFLGHFAVQSAERMTRMKEKVQLEWMSLKHAHPIGPPSHTELRSLPLGQ